MLADPKARADLNAIVHPAVFEAVAHRALSAERSAQSAQPVIIEIPLLFETGSAALFDRVVLVQAPRATILERLVAGRGLDPASAAQFLDAQADPSQVRQLSDFVIENDGSLGKLEAEARAVWRKLGQLA